MYPIIVVQGFRLYFARIFEVCVSIVVTRDYMWRFDSIITFCVKIPNMIVLASLKDQNGDFELVMEESALIPIRDINNIVACMYSPSYEA